MRVAVIFDNFGPYHVARLTAAARRCDLLAIETAGKSGDYDWDTVEQADALPRTTLFPGASGDYRIGQIARAMERALDVHRPDVVAIPGWHDRAGLSALRWARRNRIPVTIMSDSNIDDAPRARYREAVKRHIVSLCSTGLAAGSRAAQYLERLGLPHDAVTMGYDTIDNRHFASGADAARADAAALRERLALPARYFLSCSRFVAKKNLPFVIDAYARYAHARGADAWPLVLLGGGALQGDLAARAAVLGVAGSVHFPGFARYRDLPAYYGLAGGFVLASKVDQWGLVVNEAMAAGLPVLVSRRCGSASDLVVEGENGFTFDPADHAALARGLAAIAHGDAAARMGARSREIIAGWDTDRFADGLLDVARRAVDRPLPRASLLARATLGAMLL